MKVNSIKTYNTALVKRNYNNVRYKSDIAFKSNENDVTSSESNKSETKNVQLKKIIFGIVTGASLLVLAIFLLRRKKPNYIPTDKIELSAGNPRKTPTDVIDSLVKPIDVSGVGAETSTKAQSLEDYVTRYDEMLKKADDLMSFASKNKKENGVENKSLYAKANKAYRDFHAYEASLKDVPVSVIHKQNFEHPLTDEEISDYFQNHIFPRMRANETTAIDGLNEFLEKGKHYVKVGGKEIDLFEPIVNKLPAEMSDKVIGKYIDVFEKFAIPWKPEKKVFDYDSLYFMLTYDKDSRSVMENISEENLLRAIELLKKTSAKNGADPGMLLYYYAEPDVCREGKFVNNQKIKDALADLREYKEQMA